MPPTTLESPPAERPPEPPRGNNLGFLLAALGLSALALFGLALWLFLSQRPPGDGSAEAGFARDMIVHHSQAVEMAEMVRDKTDDEAIQTLATDIALTQQGQIGQMQGWLEVWGLPQTGSEPAMSWMGHPHEGLMPGMATREELNELRDAQPEQAKEIFLGLMIEHHKAAIPMAEAALGETNRPAVEELAGAIATSQEGEIRVMQDLLDELSAAPPEGIEHEEGHAHEGASGGDHSHGNDAAATPSVSGERTLDLSAANGSGVSGTAAFANTESGVEVKLDLEGLPEPGTTYLAHLHGGTCAEEEGASTDHSHDHEAASGEHDHEDTASQDNIEYPLTPVKADNGGADGSSKTVLEGVTVAGLFDGDARYVNVHAEATGSEEQPPSIVCSDL